MVVTTGELKGNRLLLLLCCCCWSIEAEELELIIWGFDELGKFVAAAIVVGYPEFAW